MGSASISVIILLNLVVYLMWYFWGATYESAQFMIDHFLVSGTALAEGRWWTLITSVFSHNMFWHLLMNMFVLNSFGPIIERALGTRRFLKFYFWAGVVSSLSHALVSSFLLHRPELPALGASGAISGIILMFSLLYPTQIILILGLIPMPAFIGSLVFVGLDLWGLYAQAEGGGLPIGHGAHLGGALTGLIYFIFFLRRTRRPTPFY